MNRPRDPRGIFLHGTGRIIPSTPTHGLVRSTSSANPLAGRFGRGGQPSRILGPQVKGKNAKESSKG